MSYQTNTATSPVDLLNQLAAWLVTIGWTQDSLANDGAGRRAHLHKGAQYINLRAAMNEGSGAIFDTQFQAGYALALYAGTGYSGASSWKAQAGGPIISGGTATAGAAMNLPNATITYHFFADASGDHVRVVVDRGSSIFTHCGWGSSINKLGFAANGAYFFGACAGYYYGYGTGGGASVTAYCPGCYGDFNGAQNLFVRVDVDAFTGKWIGFGSAAVANSGYTGKPGKTSIRANAVTVDAGIAGYDTTLEARTVCAQNAGQVPLPPLLYVDRDVGGSSLIGTLPDVFRTAAVGNGFTVGQEVAIGTATYKLFPNYAVRKVA